MDIEKITLLDNIPFPVSCSETVTHRELFHFILHTLYPKYSRYLNDDALFDLYEDDLIQFMKDFNEFIQDCSSNLRNFISLADAYKMIFYLVGSSDNSLIQSYYCIKFSNKVGILIMKLLNHDITLKYNKHVLKLFYLDINEMKKKKDQQYIKKKVEYPHFVSQKQNFIVKYNDFPDLKSILVFPLDENCFEN
jgi:disulfide oxidoreductase YuzD